MCLLSFADSKDVERVKAGNISLGDFQERDRRDLLSSGEPGEQDVCKGQCTEANQKCVDDAGIPKCLCLSGYLDGPLDDGNDCKCVYDWSQVASGRTPPKGSLMPTL